MPKFEEDAFSWIPAEVNPVASFWIVLVIVLTYRKSSEPSKWIFERIRARVWRSETVLIKTLTPRNLIGSWASKITKRDQKENVWKIAWLWNMPRGWIIVWNKSKIYLLDYRVELFDWYKKLNMKYPSKCEILSLSLN